MDRAKSGGGSLDWRVLPTGTPEHAEFCARRSAMLTAWAALAAAGYGLDDLLEEVEGTENAMRLQVRRRMVTR